MVDVFYECYKKEAHVVKDCGCFRTNLEILCVAAEIPLRSKEWNTHFNRMPRVS